MCGTGSARTGKDLGSATTRRWASGGGGLVRADRVVLPGGSKVLVVRDWSRGVVTV